MSTESDLYITILGSSAILLGCVAMIFITIVILKKSKNYNKRVRVLMIMLLILICGIAAYLVYLAFGSTFSLALAFPSQGY